MVLCLALQGPPIFFYQDRVGFNFKKFKIIKFRTMINNSGPGITEHNDLRITYIGKILRMTKLDEFLSY